MIYGIVSGYFNPLHVGHVRYLKEAKYRCDYLIVIVNNDVQQKLKKGRVIIPEDDRMEVVQVIKYVDKVILSVDRDGSVAETVRSIAVIINVCHGDSIIFMNGGDRTEDNVPEVDVCRELGIEMQFGITKQWDSSSRILAAAMRM